VKGRADVFRTIVASLRKTKDLQLVLSIGDQVDPKEIEPVPSNAIIVKHAPQLELLKQATGLYHPCGLKHRARSFGSRGSTTSHPIAYDQPGVAARIAHKKTGVVTSLAKLTADHLAGLLSKVLPDPTYRANARKLQKAIAEANGLSAAVHLIEESLGVSIEVNAPFASAVSF
jgi:zeaxanthin glucosyltransferase